MINNNYNNKPMALKYPGYYNNYNNNNSYYYY